MGLFSLLQRYQNKKYSFRKMEEYRFFLSHRDVLIKYNKFAHFYDLDDNDFNVFRANIVIYSHLNKELFDQEISSLNEYTTKNSKKFDRIKFMSALKSRIVEAPYFLEDKNKIYLPFFSRSINSIYLKNPEKLLSYPYNELSTSYTESIIDPFDTYGAELYNSYFTRLVKIATHNKTIAYYHYDTSCIYVINDQGRLDIKIALFDKYIKKPINHHMLERLEPVMNAYFNNDREAFIHSLVKQGFISHKMELIIRKKCHR